MLIPLAQTVRPELKSLPGIEEYLDPEDGNKEG
jgi:hypothetical protein